MTSQPKLVDYPTHWIFDNQFVGLEQHEKALDENRRLEQELRIARFDAAVRELREQLATFADWLERDRREPDKILCVVQSMRRAAR